VNLVANALAATPQGGTVSIRCTRDGETVSFAVEDDGYGSRRIGARNCSSDSADPGSAGERPRLVRRPANCGKTWGRVAYAPRHERERVHALASDPRESGGIMKARVVIVEDHALTRAACERRSQAKLTSSARRPTAFSGWS